MLRNTAYKLGTGDSSSAGVLYYSLSFSQVEAGDIKITKELDAMATPVGAAREKEETGRFLGAIAAETVFDDLRQRR